MTGLVVSSAILGIAGQAPTTNIAAATAGSLAWGVFRKEDKSKPLHAPNRRKRNHPSVSKLATNDATTTNSLLQLYHSWLKLPQIFRFCVAGNIGNLGFFYLEKIIYALLSHLIVTTELLSTMFLDGIEKYQDGMSFFSAYIIQIVTGHLLYAFLVYGMDTINTYEKYSKTLSGQFKVYGFGLFGATFLNSFLINSGLSKTMAFWATTGTFAIFNYFLVSWVVERAIESSGSKESAVPTRASKRR